MFLFLFTSRKSKSGFYSCIICKHPGLMNSSDEAACRQNKIRANKVQIKYLLKMSYKWKWAVSRTKNNLVWPWPGMMAGDFRSTAKEDQNQPKKEKVWYLFSNSLIEHNLVQRILPNYRLYLHLHSQVPRIKDVWTVETNESAFLVTLIDSEQNCWSLAGSACTWDLLVVLAHGTSW